MGEQADRRRADRANRAKRRSFMGDLLMAVEKRDSTIVAAGGAECQEREKKSPRGPDGRAPRAERDVQKVREPKATHLPLLRSKSMMFSPVMDRGTFSPMVNRELPKMTPVSRKSSMRTLMVDSMPVGMAP